MTHSKQYMLTLCELSAPTRIRTPNSETMRQFRFFMSRIREHGGAEKLRLHMGYFESLGQAQHWAQTMRARFPTTKVEPVPLKILQQRAPDTPVIAPAGDVPVMTDTQVLRVLEARRYTPEEVDAPVENDVRNISLVGPDETQQLRALKEAVAQGAPVLFSVQMFESAADINLLDVPSLSIFRAYTLYKTTVTRERRPLHSLRLGFFKDAISAKQVAYYVRSHFPSVAVVPVTEQEREHAKATPIETALLSDSFQRSLDHALEIKSPPPAPKPSSPPPPAPAPAPARTAPAKRSADSLEQTLEMLAASEMWNDPDSHAETGVRHLKLEVQKRKSRG
jgi:hypothetical protein